METLTHREMYIPKFIHWVEGEHTRSSKQRSEHASYKAMLKPSGFCKEKNKVWVKTKLLQLLAPPPSPITDEGQRKEGEEREKKRNNVRVYNIWWRKRYLSDLGVKTFLGYTYANNCINQKKKYVDENQLTFPCHLNLTQPHCLHQTHHVPSAAPCCAYVGSSLLFISAWHSTITQRAIEWINYRYILIPITNVNININAVLVMSDVSKEQLIWTESHN